MENLIKVFVQEYANECEEGWGLAQMFCEEEEIFRMSTGSITDIYVQCTEFINQNYSKELIDWCIGVCPVDVVDLSQEIAKIYGQCTVNRLALESLATYCLHKFQHYPFWYTIWGTEEETLLDFAKYNINYALYDAEEFPVIQQEDVVAAMLGISSTVQPSDLYNVFGYYADELSEKDTTDLFEAEEEPIFTPDPFEVAGVVARYKNYTDFIDKNGKKINSDYALTFNEVMSIENEMIRHAMIVGIIQTEYMNRFNTAPNSVKLHNDSLDMSLIEEDSIVKIKIEYKIKGIKSKRICWDNIYTGIYNIPLTALEYQNLILAIAIDFKRELNGLEKTRNSETDDAIGGKYPNKKSPTHGLNFIKDLNVQHKDKRGRTIRKTPKAKFKLALAEKQSLYLIKKSLRYADKNPVISTSFGIDSMVTHDLMKRVNKHNYKLVHNNSLVEYPQLISFKRKMIKEWDLESKLIETKPVETYWQVKEKQGWNFDRKGDRKNGTSTSEKCCEAIKHKPMYNQIDKFIEEGNPMQFNYTGLRAQESMSRMKQIKRDGVVYYAKMWKSMKISPIAWYTEEMIWEYVKKHNLPYCEVYDMTLYYEDVFDNVSDEEVGMVYYQPRIGCYSCLLNTSNGYIQWLKKFMPKHYHFMMFKKGLAQDLFMMGAKKMGIIPENISIVKNDKPKAQLSLFDTIEEVEEIKTPQYTTEDILKKYPAEIMEQWITRRPCKFL